MAWNGKDKAEPVFSFSLPLIFNNLVQNSYGKAPIDP